MDLQIKKDHRNTGKHFHKGLNGFNIKQTKSIAIRDMNFTIDSSLKQNFINSENIIMNANKILDECEINGLFKRFSQNSNYFN